MGRFRRSRALIALLVAILITATLGVPAVADLNLILGSSAQVAYTSGDGVNVRDSLGFGGSIITALPDGAAVTVQDGPVAADDGSYWYQISVNGITGWIIADYLSLPEGQYGAIANTGGSGVNVRASATTDGAVVTTLEEGTTVSLLGSQQWDGQGRLWTLIGFEGIEGWVVDQFIGPARSGGSDGGGATTQAVEQSGWTAYVSGTGGSGLRLREASSTDSTMLVAMPEGAAVSVLATEIYSADGTQWWQIDYEGIVGYSAAAYLSDTAPASGGGSDTESGQVVAQPAAEDSGESSGGGELTPGDNAEIVGTGGAGVNLRYEWGYSSGVATTVSEGAVVAVLDGPMWDAEGEPWYQVEADSVVGWVHGAYLAYSDAVPAASAEVSAADSSTEDDASESAPASSSVGQSIVDEALRYVGVPYVWGGTTPSGFDCSGFVYYVLNNVVGGLSRSLSVQATSGSHVDPANLQPGDIVFFQNTYTWGLSHNGIYIGDGQFVHAGSTSTGVTITNLSDDYWASRYYTARRVN